MEAAQAKVNALEKSKSRLQGELEDLMVDVERVSGSICGPLTTDGYRSAHKYALFLIDNT